MKKILLAMLGVGILITGIAWTTETSPPVQVWGAAVSPYVRKVLSVLEEKKIPYTLQPVLPISILEATNREVSPQFRKISPLGKIPVLEVEDFSINDSSVISAYIERKWPTTALYPKQAEAYAQALWLERYADTIMSEVFHALLFESFVKPHELKQEVDKIVVANLIGKLPTVYSYLEAQLEKSSGQYLVGTTLSIADIAILQHFVSLDIAGISVELQAYPLLSKYVAAGKQLPSIQAAINKI